MSSKQRNQPSRSLSQLMSQAQKRAPGARRREAQAAANVSMVVKSISLTPETANKLEELCSMVGETAGRKISASALVRALIARHNDTPRNIQQLAKQIEAERDTGSVIWGKSPRTRK